MKLRTGDLIFFKSYGSIIEKLIQFFTRSEYVHVACFTGNNTIVEAMREGVREREFKESWLNEMNIVQRHKYATPVQLNRAINFMLSQVGKKYDFLGLVGIAYALVFKKKNNILDSKNRYWCSELVADGYHYSGLAVGCSKKTYKVSPADLIKSGLFQEVL